MSKRLTLTITEDEFVWLEAYRAGLGVRSAAEVAKFWITRGYHIDVAMEAHLLINGDPDGELMFFGDYIEMAAEDAELKGRAILEAASRAP